LEVSAFALIKSAAESRAVLGSMKARSTRGTGARRAGCPQRFSRKLHARKQKPSVNTTSTVEVFDLEFIVEM